MVPLADQFNGQKPFFDHAMGLFLMNQYGTLFVLSWLKSFEVSARMNFRSGLEQLEGKRLRGLLDWFRSVLECSWAWHGCIGF